MIVSHSFYVQALYDEYQSPVRALFFNVNFLQIKYGPIMSFLLYFFQ